MTVKNVNNLIKRDLRHPMAKQNTMINASTTSLNNHSERSNGRKPRVQKSITQFDRRTDNDISTDTM